MTLTTLRKALTPRQYEVFRMIRQGSILTWDNLNQRYKIKNKVGMSEIVDIATVQRLFKLELLTPELTPQPNENFV